MEVWLAPALVLIGAVIAALFSWLSSKVASGPERAKANVLLIAELYTRLGRVEAIAAEVPELRARAARCEHENRVLRRYIQNLKEKMDEEGIKFPMISWVPVEDDEYTEVM